MAERDVLILEDDRQILEVLHRVFVAAGYNCVLAHDGREGLQVFRQTRPSLVVTELQIPAGGASDLVQEVRREDPDAAVILLIRPADAKAAIACLKLGAYACLMKPINGDELLITAQRALERRQLLIDRRQHHDTPGRLCDTRQRDVLIVEEESGIRDLLHRVFLSAGYRCLLASDGEEGLRVFRESRPSLVVTDLGMPMRRHGPSERDAGIRLLQQIRREDPDAAIILESGMADVQTMIKSLHLGAEAFLMKPLLVDELLITAERAIERRQLLTERRRRLEGA